jgi:hypothetical protein
MAMLSALTPHANYGENGEGETRAVAYPHLAIGSTRLSRPGKTRDEFAAVGGDSPFLPRTASYPKVIPAFPAAYS